MNSWRNVATSATATMFCPCLTHSRLMVRPRLPVPIRPMFSFSLAPRALTAGAPRASAPAPAADDWRKVRRVCMGRLRAGAMPVIVPRHGERGKRPRPTDILISLMPRRSPFTSVARRLAQLSRPRLADLHVHTTASDGEFTPAQVVALARQAALCAVAITDHDTLAAADAAGEGIEVIPAVEITAGFAGRELHLLGYFVRTDHGELSAALARLRERRRERFFDFAAKLADHGTALPADRVKLVAESSASLGRRHVASLLVACQFARTRTEAFGRFLGPVAGKVTPQLLL